MKTNYNTEDGKNKSNETNETKEKKTIIHFGNLRGPWLTSVIFSPSIHPFNQFKKKKIIAYIQSSPGTIGISLTSLAIDAFGLDIFGFVLFYVW